MGQPEGETGGPHATLNNGLQLMLRRFRGHKHAYSDLCHDGSPFIGQIQLPRGIVSQNSTGRNIRNGVLQITRYE
jgi:hypothetical protein